MGVESCRGLESQLTSFRKAVIFGAPCHPNTTFGTGANRTVEAMTILQDKTSWTREKDVVREWYHADASGQVLGRLAVRVARALMGKHKPSWTPGVDVGNFVVITNAEKVALTGSKLDQKFFRYHTGHSGGLVEISYAELLQKKPEKVLELAVRRMLPKTKLGRQFFKRLKVYAGPEHPHSAQQPVALG